MSGTAVGADTGPSATETVAGSEHHRYPGPGSFADNEFDARVFFGRSSEVTELTDRIAGDRMLVLYGKSGLGKTSLLQAGLFPRLRAARLLPVRLRPTGFDEENIFDVVTRAFRLACETQGYEFTPGEGGNLWEYFHTALVSRGDEFLDPVLVFDQFEEVFTRKDAAFRERLAEELRVLLSALAPPAKKGERNRSADDKRRFPPQPPNVRIVLSLREEYVGALDDFAAFVPGLLNNRFRLHPLSREAAQGAIEGPPGESGVVFASAPFEFAPGQVEKILDFLVDKYGNVEPIELQIICQHIERQVIRDSGSAGFDATKVIAPDPNKMKDVLGDFYLETVGPVALTGGSGFRHRLEARRVRQLCEYGLVSDDGFRETLPERRIEREFKVRVATLDKLVDARLIRREDRLNDNWYELTHDRIAGAVKANRRSTRPMWLSLAAAVFVIVAFVLAQQYGDYREQAAIDAFAGKINDGDPEAILAVLPGIQALSEQSKRALFFEEKTRGVFLAYFERRIREKFDPQNEAAQLYEFEEAQSEVETLALYLPYPDLVAELRSNLTSERESLIDSLYSQLDSIRDQSAQKIPDLGDVVVVLGKLRMLDGASARLPVAYTDWSVIAGKMQDFETALRLVDAGLSLLPGDLDSGRELMSELINLRDEASFALAQFHRANSLESTVTELITDDFSEPPDAPVLRELGQLRPDSAVLGQAREMLETWLEAQLKNLPPSDPAGRALLENYVGLVEPGFRERWLDVLSKDNRAQIELAEKSRADIERLLGEYQKLVDSLVPVVTNPVITADTIVPAGVSQQVANVAAAATEQSNDVALREAMAAFAAASLEAEAIAEMRRRIGEFYVGYARVLRNQQRIAAAQRQLEKAAEYDGDSRLFSAEERELAALRAGLERGEQERLVASVEILARSDPNEAKNRLESGRSAFPDSDYLRDYRLPDPCSDPDLVGNGSRRRASCRDGLAQGVLGPELVVIPARDRFTDAVAVGRYEISVGDYDKYCRISGECEERGKVNPALPLTDLTVEQANAYVRWLSETSGAHYRLPTSAEWVHAANAGGNLPGVNVNCRVLQKNQMISGLDLLPVSVGAANGWGLVNCVGNAREWAAGAAGGWEARGGAYTDSINRCSIDLVVPHVGKADAITGFRVFREIR